MTTFWQLPCDVINAGSLKPTKIVVGPVAILPDGSIERTKDFTTTDEAAMAFWNAVDRLAPTFLQARTTLNEALKSGAVGIEKLT